MARAGQEHLPRLAAGFSQAMLLRCVGEFLHARSARLLVLPQLAPQAGFAFVIYLDTTRPSCNSVAHRFLRGAMDYSGKYLGKPYTAEERVEIDRLFGA